MPEEVFEVIETATVVETTTDLPAIHQFGRLMIGVAAGFAATKLAEKLYTVAYETWIKK